MSKRLYISVLFLLTFVSFTFGQNTPKGFTIPDDTLSPDKHYGVNVPITDEHLDNDGANDAVNSLVDTKDGHVLAEIVGDTGWDRMNHGGILPSRWSSDSSILVWQVDGKWSDCTLVVIKLRDGKVQWQANVLKLGEQAILARTKNAASKKYALVKKMNADFAGGVDDPHSAYPDGFSIQVDAVDPVSFPLHITAELTSEAKPDTDMYGVLASHLTGMLNANGKLTVTSFHLGRAKPSHF